MLSNSDACLFESDAWKGETTLKPTTKHKSINILPTRRMRSSYHKAFCSFKAKLKHTGICTCVLFSLRSFRAVVRRTTGIPRIGCDIVVSSTILPPQFFLQFLLLTSEQNIVWAYSFKFLFSHHGHSKSVLYMAQSQLSRGYAEHFNLRQFPRHGWKDVKKRSPEFSYTFCYL